MTELTIRVCRLCCARVGDGEAAVCPACGGALLAESDSIPDSIPGPPPQFDHRGIELPRRHAVGGVITPR